MDHPMNGKLNQNRKFLEAFSPIFCLSGCGLIIMATDRLAHAIVAAVALVWVYCLTSLAAHAAARIFPNRGRTMLIAFLASFVAAIFLWLVWLFSPLCALETFFVVSLVPIFCAGSGTFNRLEELGMGEAVLTFFVEALIVGGLLVLFALVREPFGFLSLSLPGGAQGMVLIFSFDAESVLPVRIVAGSSGALLLLGYIFGLHEHYKSQRREKQ